MSTTTAGLFVEKFGAFPAILWGGLAAGTLDITAAFIQYGLRGVSPIRILRSVASGLLGRASFNGGLKTAALGLVCHFVIATGAAATYYAASRRLPWLTTQAVICGILYGVAVYFFMNLVVLPLSAFPNKITFPLGALVTGLLIHMFCVGLPIALAVRHYANSGVYSPHASLKKPANTILPG